MAFMYQSFRRWNSFGSVLLLWVSVATALKIPQVVSSLTAIRSSQDDLSVSPMDMEPWKAQTMKSQYRLAGWLVDCFARVGQRNPPSAKKTRHIRLIAIAVSHYVEKVRWALDLLLELDAESPFYYTEDCHPPGIAAYYTIAASQDRASQSPMIVQNSNNGQVIWGSEGILQHLSSMEGSPLAFLYPPKIKDQILQLEQDLGLRLGASARCVAYNALLRPKHYSAATKVITNHCPLIEKILYKMLVYTGKVPQIMAQTLKTTDPDVIANSYQTIRDIFEEMSNRLAKAAASNNDDVYLMDTKTQRYGLTAAGIAFASLAYMLLRPPEASPLHISRDEMPPELMALSQELTATRAGQHALQVYRNHRPVDPATNCLSIQRVHQNRVPWKGMPFLLLTMMGAVRIFQLILGLL